MNKKKIIIAIFVAAFLLRVVFAFGYQWYIETRGEGVAFASDESYYLTLAWFQTLLLKRGDLLDLPPANYAFMDPIVKDRFIDQLPNYAGIENGYIPLTGGRIYSLMVGFLYFIFGYSPLLARFFSIFIGLLAALIVYFMAKSVFNKNIAGLSFIFFAFLPGQIFLSISILRDILTIFAVVSLLLLIYKIKDIKSFMIFSIPLLLALSLCFYSSNFLFYLLLAPLGIATIVKILDFKKRKILSFILVAAILVISFNSRNSAYLNNFFKSNYTKLLDRHIVRATQLADTSYRLLPDKFYDKKKYEENRKKKLNEIFYSKKGVNIDQFDFDTKDFYSRVDVPDRERAVLEQALFMTDIDIRYVLGAYLKGLSYVFFRPFPWHIKKLTHLLASIQMIILYILFPFVCMGLFNAFRNPTKDKFILIIFFFSLASVLALGEGVVGGLFKHREVISFAYAIFGAAGVASIFLKDKKV